MYTDFARTSEFSSMLFEEFACPVLKEMGHAKGRLARAIPRINVCPVFQQDLNEHRSPHSRHTHSMVQGRVPVSILGINTSSMLQ